MTGQTDQDFGKGETTDALAVFVTVVEALTTGESTDEVSPTANLGGAVPQ
jgi:hypothetical protein